MEDLFAYVAQTYDFGWIADREGNKVWEMTYDQTKNSGGAYLAVRERMAVVELPAGTYFLHYQTNEN